MSDDRPGVEIARLRYINSLILQAREFDAEAQRRDRLFYPMLRRSAFKRRAEARRMEAGIDL